MAGYRVERETSLARGDAALCDLAHASLVVPTHVGSKAHAGRWAGALAAVRVLDVWRHTSVLTNLLLDVTDASAIVSLEIVAVVADLHANLVTNTVILVKNVTRFALETASVKGPFALASRTVPVVAFPALEHVGTEVFAHASRLDESRVLTALKLASRVARASVLVDGVVLWALKKTGRRALAIVQIKGVEHRAGQFASRLALAAPDVGSVEGWTLNVASRFTLADVSVDLEEVGATQVAGRVTSAHTFVHLLEWMGAVKVASRVALAVHVVKYPVLGETATIGQVADVAGRVTSASVNVGLFPWVGAL